MKKLFVMFAIAGSLVACNNSSDTTDATRDSMMRDSMMRDSMMKAGTGTGDKMMGDSSNKMMGDSSTKMMHDSSSKMMSDSSK